MSEVVKQSIDFLFNSMLYLGLQLTDCFKDCLFGSLVIVVGDLGSFDTDDGTATSQGQISMWVSTHMKRLRQIFHFVESVGKNIPSWDSKGTIRQEWSSGCYGNNDPQEVHDDDVHPCR
jgi:hypothetical protein